jgi:WD40-like Beta Propeller Repeat
MNRDRPVLRGLAAAGISWLLLVGAIALGMVVPTTENLSGFGAAGPLDYSAYGSGFSQLSSAFIGDVLGLEDPRSAGRDASNGRSDAAVASGGTSAPGEITAATGGTTDAPTDVEHPFTNDDVENAYTVSSLPFRGRTDTSEGTRGSDEPGDCFPTGGTAWYGYRPTTDVALFSDTFGTSRATALGIYSRSASGGLELIGCDKNALGNAQVGFPAEAGTAYYFQVTSMVRGGPTIFELAAVGRTTVESLAPSGAPADGPAFDRADISADGRYVVFTSLARNLTSPPPDCGTVYCRSVYLRDRVTRETDLISSHSTPGPQQGAEAYPEYSSLFPALSPDGRYVGFAAPPARLQVDREESSGWPFDNNSYLYDRVTERVKLVSRNSRGEPARRVPTNARNTLHVAGALGPSVSADGRYVVFNSDGQNMPGQSDPSHFNVYRRDLVAGKTRLVSTTPSGEPNHSYNCAATGRNVSGDGRYVVFYSTYGPGGAGELVYLWDARTGRSRLVTRVLSGNQVLGSYCPSISRDGSRVALVSRDPLVPEDTNNTPDVYAYEVATGRIQRISVTSDGKQTYDPNYQGREYGFLKRSVNLSADGRFAVFDSSAPDLAPSTVGSTRHPPETTRVFVHDILTGATVLVSVSSTGEPLGGDSHMPYISADGSAVVFMNTPLSGQERVMVHELSLLR